MTVKEILHDTETKMKKTIEATQREFSTIRTGRASTAILDSVKVDYYGTPNPASVVLDTKGNYTNTNCSTNPNLASDQS